jgi:mannosyltransferase OCH1-like enzyme
MAASSGVKYHLYFLTGSLIAVFFVIIFLVFLVLVSVRYNMLLVPRYQLTGAAPSKFDSETETETPLGASPLGPLQAAQAHSSIPQILHQTWKSSNVPATHRRWVDTWRQGLPHWQHILHSDQDMEAFAHKHFPEFMPVWERLHPIIKRVDTVRYMWMFIVGGLYTDLDTSLEDAVSVLQLLDTRGMQAPVAFVPAESTRLRRNSDAASPAVVASHPGHPFWIKMLQYIAANGWRADVKHATGPVAVTNVLRDWAANHATKNQQRAAATVVLLSEARVGIGRFKAFPGIPHHVQHHNTGLWTQGRFQEPWPYPHDVIRALEMRSPVNHK